MISLWSIIFGFIPMRILMHQPCPRQWFNKSPLHFVWCKAPKVSIRVIHCPSDSMFCLQDKNVFVNWPITPVTFGKNSSTWVSSSSETRTLPSCPWWSTCRHEWLDSIAKCCVAALQWWPSDFRPQNCWMLAFASASQQLILVQCLTQ